MIKAPETNEVYPSYPQVNETLLKGVRVPEVAVFAEGSAMAGTCGDDERGHASKGGGGMVAHMAYNQDQYYIVAASCYIAKKYREAAGRGAAGSR
jgi:hypothetical protein